jgi:ribonuclease I
LWGVEPTSPPSRMSDADTYFREAVSLIDEVNRSAVQTLVAANVGQEITASAVRHAFDVAFGAGAGDRIRLSCQRDGSRRLITEITTYHRDYYWTGPCPRQHQFTRRAHEGIGPHRSGMPRWHN